MSRFYPLDNSVVLRQGGVFFEHQVYHNAQNELFARKGNGYIRLMDHQATSKSRVFWQELDVPAYTINLSRLYLATTPSTKRKAA